MNKFWEYSSITQFAIIAFLVFYMNSCMKCPPYPVAVNSTTTRIDTVFIHDTVKTTLTKFVKTKSVKPLETNCDSLWSEHESVYVYQTDLSDSLMQGWIKQTISRNKIIYTEKDFKYLIPTNIDSVTVFVDRPVFKNTFTIGCFMSKHSSGLSVGYRSERIHVTAGYDLNNSSPVIGFNYDLR